MKYTLYILILFFIACKSTQPKESTSALAELHDNEPQIAFYFLEALKTSRDSIEIKLNKQKIVKGKLKETYLDKIPVEKIQNTNWLASFLNNARKSKIQIQIINPLIEEVEYVNEEGLLEKRTIYHDKKEFVLRIPYDNSVKSVNFEGFRIINQKITPYYIDQIIIK